VKTTTGYTKPTKRDTHQTFKRMHWKLNAEGSHNKKTELKNGYRSMTSMSAVSKRLIHNWLDPLGSGDIRVFAAKDQASPL